MLWQARQGLIAGRGALDAAAAVGGGGYTAQAVHFDFAAPTAIKHTGVLTGAVDSKVGTVSFWFNYTGHLSNGMMSFESAYGSAEPIQMNFGSSRMNVTCNNAAGAGILRLWSDTNYNTTGWKHFIASWNLATSTGTMYLNDVSVMTAPNTMTNDIIPWATATGQQWWQPDPGAPMDWDIADFWFDTNTFIDLTVTANRRKFIDAAGKTVNLGTNGQTPTGTAPMVFFTGNNGAANWVNNLGTGGTFALNSGTITAGSSNPPGT